MTQRTRSKVAWVAMIGGLALMAAAFALPVEADPPPGNNGVVKIAGVDIDAQPGNEPHVGCTFDIDFYGYEAGLPVSIVIDAQPPTGTGQLFSTTGVLDGDDATGGGSQAGHDGRFPVDLTAGLAGFDPQPQQGYHLKLTVTVDDGNPQGAQTKTKTFWASGCEPPPETTTTTEPTTTTTTEPEATTTEPEATTTEPEATTTEPEATTTEPEATTTEPGGVLPTITEPEATTTEPEATTTEPEATTTEPDEVLTTTAEAGAAPDDDGPRSRLARTGMGTELAVAGALALLVGLGLQLSVLWNQRRQRKTS